MHLLRSVILYRGRRSTRNRQLSGMQAAGDSCTATDIPAGDLPTIPTMSGPKSSSYSVRSMELERQRKLRSVQDGCRRLVSELSAVVGEVAAAVQTWGIAPLSIVVPSSPMPVTAAECEVLATDLQEIIEKARSELHDATTSANKDSIAALLGGAFTALAVPDHPTKSRSMEQSDSRDTTRIERRLSTLVESAASLGDEQLNSQISQLIEKVPRLGEARLEMEFMSVQLAVQKATDARAEIEHRRDRRSKLLASLDGFASETIDHLRVLVLEAGLNTDLSPDIGRRVAGAVDDARRHEDAAFAVAAIESSLENIGYAVGDGFTVSVASPSGTIVPLPGRSDYGVRIREEQGRFDFNVVRFGDGQDQQARDLDAETSWCQDLEKLRVRMERAGVAMPVERRNDPGSVPVQVLDRRPKGQGKAKRAKPKERAR